MYLKEICDINDIISVIGTFYDINNLIILFMIKKFPIESPSIP